MLVKADQAVPFQIRGRPYRLDQHMPPAPVGGTGVVAPNATGKEGKPMGEQASMDQPCTATRMEFKAGATANDKVMLVLLVATQSTSSAA